MLRGLLAIAIRGLGSRRDGGTMSLSNQLVGSRVEQSRTEDVCLETDVAESIIHVYFQDFSF